MSSRFYQIHLISVLVYAKLEGIIFLGVSNYENMYYFHTGYP